MRYLVRFTSAVATAFSAIWFYAERSFERAIVTVAGLAGVISSFLAGHRDKSTKAALDGVSTRGQRIMYRTDVERGIDDLVSHEATSKFQSLAVILAKQRWPDLIASERKWDLGRDAYAPAVASTNGRAMAFACSITGTIGKIKADAARIREKSADVDILVFCTAQKVTNHTAGKWADEIETQFDFELIVMSREDLITSLMDPANAVLCATLLGISIPTAASTRNVLKCAQEACDDEVDDWLKHRRLRDVPLIRLGLFWSSNADTDVNGSLDLEAVQHELSLGKRLVLEAPAGAGKTTTLLQLAKLTPATGTLRMIVDLPGWIDSGSDILDFVACSPNFRSRGIEARDLAALQETAHFDFLLNGWNEISERRFESAARRLSALERNYPAAGIIVATRASLIKPPLPGSSRIRVRELTAEQRKEYLLKALGGSGHDLVALIQDNHTLDHITRNPLFLAEVAQLFDAGLPIPETKLDIINAMAERIQSSEEHAASLETAPLSGQSAKFLSALAYEMTRGSAVDLLDEEARQTVSLQAGLLVADGQLANSPEPASVLDALCGHHVLERIEYPQTTFRFQHQQFQEFYAALRLIGLLEDATGNQDPDRIRQFKTQYLDQPVWEESLKMIAAAIGAGSPVFGPEASPVRIGECLVRWAIPVDPVYAAALSRECGDEVWSRVGSELAECLLAWYEVEDLDHRRCALAGMLASGSSDFMNIIVPLLTSDDQQVRLTTYRALGDFHVSSLGADWRTVIKAWCDEHRIEFLHEVVMRTELADIAEEFAVTDPSEAVRMEAVGVLSWLWADDALERVCTQLNDESLVELFRQGTFLPDLPISLYPRVVATLRTIVDGQEDVVGRLSTLVRAAGFGDDNAPEELLRELDHLSPTDLQNLNDELLSSVLAVVEAAHEEWVGRWLAEQIASGSLWPERWIGRVATVDLELLSRLVDEIGNGEVERRKVAGATALAAKTTADKVAEIVCRRLYQLQTERMNSKGDGTERLRSTISRQLEDFARGLPTGRLVSGMLDTISSPPTLAELLVVLGLFGRIGDEESDIREGLNDTERASLRKALVDAVPFVLAQEDFGGGLKAELAMAMARVGNPEDAVYVRQLIAADVDRRRTGQAVRERGERGPMANGAATTWSTWYTKALTWFGADVAEPILLELLGEPECETDAAAALAHIARGQKATLGGALGLSAGNERAVVFVDDEKRVMYASAIATRVRALLQQRDVSESPDALTWRLEGLSSVLAHIDGRDSMDLVMRVMVLPASWDGWTRADALDHLLEWGVRLPVEPTLEIVSPSIEHALSQGINDQNNRYLVERLLRILVLVDDPARGLARVREVVASASLGSYGLRNLVKALGESRSEEALDLLLELASERHVPREFGREWLDAVAAIDSTRSRSLLLGFVERDESEWNYEAPHDLHGSIGSHLATVARREPQVKDRVLELCADDVSSPQREILANVVAELGTPDAVLAGLGLIDDHADTPVPYHLLKAIERLLVEHRPYPGSGNAYMLVSRSGSDVRRRLFDCSLSDNNRRRSALKLLAEIEGWRFDHGKPMSEPWHPAIDMGQPWPPLDAVQTSRRPVGE